MRLSAVIIGVVLVGTSDGRDETKLIERPDAFKSLVNPNCSHCRDEAKRRADELKPNDPVLCWIRGYSDGGAIQHRFFLNPYRVISDTYGVFVYDSDAGYSRGFAPSLEFDFHGWRNGVMVMKHKDGTLYSCLTGIAFDGPKKGTRLKTIPTLVSTWGHWLVTYPQAVAYHMYDKYTPTELSDQLNADSVKSRGPLDERMKADDRILGIVVGNSARAYPIEQIAKTNLLHDEIDGKKCIVFWHAPTKCAVAYHPVASPPKKDQAEPRSLNLEFDDKEPNAPFRDKETGSRWDIAGRAENGDLRDWTLEWIDGVQVKWFAWSAEYPKTTIYGEQKQAIVNAAIKEVAGSAEFLRHVPKHFATVFDVNVIHNKVTLRFDGEQKAKTWPLTPDAEIKIQGWWGRLEQVKPDDRVWVWLHLNRKKEPTAIFMLADAASEKAIHNVDGKLTIDNSQQRRWLRERWLSHGLPGTVGFVHVYSGEVDVLVDHEAMRWARSLQQGDKVSLAADPPIKAIVKQVEPQREKTRVRLVIHSLDLSEVTTGGRVGLKMPAPSADIEKSPYPPDIDRPCSKDERIEWFLASIYCTCPIGNDICTGDFYTLASCNPNGCGMPNATRRVIAQKIDAGKSNREIFDELLQQRHELMTRPHLVK